MSKALELADVGDELGVAPQTVEHWIKHGELRAVNVSRNPRSQRPRLRVMPEELRRFVEARAFKGETVTA